MIININCDGGSRGNPGPGACAFVIVDENQNPIYQSMRYLGVTTNNQAEYDGVLDALRYISDQSELNISQINFWLDSLLVVNQIKGLYKINDPKLFQKHQEVKTAMSKLNISTINFNHIPRSKNAVADSLVNQVLDENK